MPKKNKGNEKPLPCGTKEPRRSERVNKGIPPRELQDYITNDDPFDESKSVNMPDNVSTPRPNSSASLQFSQDISNISDSKTLTEEHDGQFNATVVDMRSVNAMMESVLMQVRSMNLETVREMKKTTSELEKRLERSERDNFQREFSLQPAQQPFKDPVNPPTRLGAIPKNVFPQQTATQIQPQIAYVNQPDQQFVAQSQFLCQQNQPNGFEIPTQNQHTQQEPIQLNPQPPANQYSQPQQFQQQSFFRGPQIRHKIYDLPTFSGNAEDWPMFYSSFVETTNAYGYSHLENLIRLQKCLQGEARQVVNAMLIHAENVPHILNELQFRFGRSDLLVKSQIAKLKKISPMKEEDLTQLISFSTTVRNLVVFLKGAGAEQHLNNPILIEELIGKLPMSRRLDWARYVAVHNPVPSAYDFALWLTEVAKVASIVESTTSGMSKQPSKKYTLYVNNESVANDPECEICQQKHDIRSCRKFLQLNIQERWNVVKKNHICFSCLKKGHRVLNCRSKKRCNVDKCELKHHPLLHEKKDRKNQPEEKSSPETAVPVLSLKQPDANVYFCIVPVTLINQDRKIDTYAILDTGSSVSLMEDSLSNDLGLQGRRDEMEIQWLDNAVVKKHTTLVNCIIQGNQRASRQLQLKNVRTMSDLQLPIQSLDFTTIQQKYPQLLNVPIKNYANVKPRLLIGLDNARLGYPRRWVDCYPNGPLAVESDIGWYIYGPDQSSKQHVNIVKILMVKSQIQDELDAKYEELDEIVRDYCELENLGVKKPSVELESEADKRARQILKETTKLVSDRYETGLLWKADDVAMPDSFPMATKRFYNLVNKMKRDPEFASKYRKGMDDFIQKNYAKKLTPEEASIVTERVWYLPHFAVSNPNKPDKLRIVFDAAASVNKTSLNSVLLKGPDLNQPLLSVLSRFREKSVAVCGDIREMFCQIKVIEPDRHSQRFVYHESDTNRDLAIYQMTSMTFGATCSPTSAQHVKNVNAQRFQNDFPKAVDAIVRGHYVDDYVMSFQTDQEAIEVTDQVKMIHKKAGFDLRNFISNSIDVNTYLTNADDQATTKVNMNVESIIGTEKILGLYWHNETDQFAFEFKLHRVPADILQQIRPPTKREVLCLTMSLFDPFGFIANFTVTPKILLQAVWNEKCDWDQPLSDTLCQKWYQWQCQLEHIKKIVIPRCYSQYFVDAVDLELHTFVDASESAFAAVCYWRFKTPEGIKVIFVQAKTRVAPRKPMSIPRLELQSAVLGVRLCKSVINNHDMKPVRRFFHTDSSTVKHWINSEARNYKQFVSHRISEILDESHSQEWRWVPTNMNPADDATRANLSIENRNTDRWFYGPEFLYLSEEDWPASSNDRAKIDESEERRTKCIFYIGKSNILNIDVTRFSKYRKAIRTMGWVLRVMKPKERLKGELSLMEESEAEKYICRTVQQQSFKEEYYQLERGGKIESSSSLYRLSPYLDENGLIRLEGRIDAASTVPFDTRRPIILPAKHPFTRLMIVYHHEQIHHQNFETVVCQIRQKFWVPCIRNELKSVIKNCQICRIKNAKPRQPIMGQLPLDRVTPYVRPFTFTGLDYFGPVTVTIGRRKEKRWIALFTCLTYRAVHLELAADLSTDSCLLCIRSFVSLRGRPIRMRSDNGTNFVGIKRELENVVTFFDQNKVQSELNGLGIEWIFNSPSDPSAGGVWERLVQSVKRVLNMSLKERNPKEETLRTFLAEAANIVNSRPITHMPVSPEDEEPLTPNHFLLGTMNSSHVPTEVSERHMRSRKQWEILQQLRAHFYKRWIDEYLPMLTRRCKWFEKTRPINEGELVMICDSNVPRSQWPKGRVIKTYQGSDGQIRAADVQTLTGILKRPVNKLAILDIEVNPVGPTKGGMSPTTVKIGN